MITSFSRKQIKSRMFNGPIDENNSLFEEIRSMGFKYEESWIVNPYWSSCGRFQVDPVDEYGMDFLLSPLASYLGFSLPAIKLPPQDLMDPESRKAYDMTLLKQVMKTISPTD